MAKQFLDNAYQKGIIEIDRESGWFHDEDLGEWIACFYYYSLLSGFDPQKMKFGKYAEKHGVFTNEDGTQRKIDWKAY